MSIVLLIVARDFFALVLPAMMFPVSAGDALVVLIIDAGCMIYLAAVLYAAHAKEDLRKNIRELNDSKYKYAPA